MPIGAHLKHRCKVFKPQVSKDEYENERRDFPEAAEPDIEGLSCLYIVKERVRRDSETSELVTVTQTKLFVPHGTDVEIGDRVTDIELEDKTLTGPFDVINALPRRRARSRSHLTLVLKEIE